MSLVFYRDPAKAQRNLRKHGVSFEEAETVFLDPLAITVADEVHSTQELREHTMGYSVRLRLLLVVHTEEVDGEIRIISARKADAYERGQYPRA